MITNEMHFQSEDETLVVDISKNDEYGSLGGWDVEVHQFPMGNLMGSYNDIGKLIDDIRPFTYRLDQEERIAFAEEFKKISL